MSLTIEHESRGALPLLRLSGEVEIATAPQLKEAILAALNDAVPSLVLDFSGVEFLDSTGIQVLISAKKRTAERGGEVYCLGIHGHVQRVFTLLGLQKVFTLCHETDLPG